MLTIVEEASFENGITIDCPVCKAYQEIKDERYKTFKEGSASLFFSLEKKKLIAVCACCGSKNHNDELILSQETKCEHCTGNTTVKDIRENVPCQYCGETNNRVVATTRYYSRIPVK